MPCEGSSNAASGTSQNPLSGSLSRVLPTQQLRIELGPTGIPRETNRWGCQHPCAGQGLSRPGPVPQGRSLPVPLQATKGLSYDAPQVLIFANFMRDLVADREQGTGRTPAAGEGLETRASLRNTIPLPRKLPCLARGPEKAASLVQLPQPGCSYCTTHDLPVRSQRNPVPPGRPHPASPHSQAAFPHPRWLRNSFARYSLPNSSMAVRFPPTATCLALSQNGNH